MTKVFYFFCLLFYSQALIGQAPDFSVSTEDGLYCNPSRITFTSTVSGSPVGYVWTFGNGSVSNSKNPVITYSRAGSFTVRLLVIYASSTSQVTKTINIHPAVTATIGVDRNFICTPGDINFTASASGASPTYEWNFEDGSAIQTTTDGNISHRYTDMGSYNVSVKAISAAGCNITKTTSVRLAPTKK